MVEEKASKQRGTTSFQAVISICAVGLVLILGWALVVQPETERRDEQREADRVREFILESNANTTTTTTTTIDFVELLDN